MINKVILIGNVGADPEVRYIKEDQPVANIRLATTERGFKRQDGTEVPDRTEWHRLTVWGHTAKFVEMYVKKGDQLYVEGRLHYSQYQDKNNETRYSTEIVVEELRKLARKLDSNGQTESTQQPQRTAQDVVAEANAEYSIPDQPVDDLPF
jgi:single-strand DNA-binding protein